MNAVPSDWSALLLFISTPVPSTSEAGSRVSCRMLPKDLDRATRVDGDSSRSRTKLAIVESI